MNLPNKYVNLLKNKLIITSVLLALWEHKHQLEDNVVIGTWLNFCNTKVKRGNFLEPNRYRKIEKRLHQLNKSLEMEMEEI